MNTKHVKYPEARTTALVKTYIRAVWMTALPHSGQGNKQNCYSCPEELQAPAAVASWRQQGWFSHRCWLVLTIIRN